MTAWKKSVWALGAVLALGAAAGSHYLTTAKAAPYSPARLFYSGILEQGGVPLDSPSTSVLLRLFDAAAAGTQVCPDVNPGPTAVVSGHFRVELTTACVDALRTNGQLWVEVIVGAVTLGRQAIGVTPRALEAELSTQAGAAVNGGSIDNRINAAQADATALQSSKADVGHNHDGTYQAAGTMWIAAANAGEACDDKCAVGPGICLTANRVSSAGFAVRGCGVDTIYRTCVCVGHAP